MFGPVPVPPDGIGFGRLAEGGYRAVVASGNPGGPPPVTKPFLVIEPIDNARGRTEVV